MLYDDIDYKPGEMIDIWVDFSVSLFIHFTALPEITELMLVKFRMC